MFEQESVVNKLSDKINDLLVRFEEINRQNESFRQEIVTLKAQNEAKSVQITKLEEELAQKNRESDDILGKIEEVLKKMSKLTVSIGSKDFDIKLDGEFAEYFEEHFKSTFGEFGKVETKELLWAYVQKCYDEYLNNTELEKIYKKIENV